MFVCIKSLKIFTETMYFTEANIPARLNRTRTGKPYRTSINYIEHLHYMLQG